MSRRAAPKSESDSMLKTASGMLACAERHRNLLVEQLIEEWESSGRSVSAGVICSLDQLVAVDALLRDLRKVDL